MKMAGYDHIVITGKADHPVYLWIDNDRVEIRDDRALWEKNTWQTDELIKETGIQVAPCYWLQYETKAELMRWHENWHCVVDSLGLCKLEGIALKPLLPIHFQRMLAAATGWDVSVQDLERIGERIWNVERLFNVRQGKNRKDDLPPRRLLEESISTGPAQGERLERGRYEAMLTEYYLLRGWSPDTGVPTKEKRIELGLE
jgi:aldehyde:ferredoxin oxidoreductase